ncbi:hypothetical protein AUK22_10480 [bacterium CG2_30_54_10]|nr:MAG: hypothetical protein AUK22_10480 [bacterium CG2_30_54_10]
MNPRFLCQTAGAGLLAGYASWLTFREPSPWSFGDGFLATVLTTGVFVAVFMGLGMAFPPLFNEWNARKAARFFFAAAAPAMAFAMPAAVIYAIAIGYTGLAKLLPVVVMRAAWWSLLATAMAGCRGFLTGSVGSACYSLSGFLPGLLFPGLMLDLFFLPRGMWLLGALFFGVVAAVCFAISLDLLKEAWLEDLTNNSPWRPEFILESEELVAGADPDCDLVIPRAPSHLFSIIEKDGLHILESVDDTPIEITGGKFRCRLLVDGDLIEVPGMTIIYRNRLARTRDVLPEAAF